MLTKDDLIQIKETLKPEFDSLRNEINDSEERMKEYVQDAAKTIIKGVESLLEEKDYDNRIKRLEQIVL